MLTGGVVSFTLLAMIDAVVRLNLVSWLAALIIMVLMLRDLGVLPFALPQRLVQIPKQLIEGNPTYGAAVFGLQLGVGWLTRQPVSVIYMLSVFLVAQSASLALAAAIGLGFGLGRAIDPWLRKTSSNAGEYDAALFSQRLQISRLASVATAGGLVSSLLTV